MVPFKKIKLKDHSIADFEKNEIVSFDGKRFKIKRENNSEGILLERPFYSNPEQAVFY